MNKNSKKLLALICILSLCLSLTACDSAPSFFSGTASQKDKEETSEKADTSKNNEQTDENAKNEQDDTNNAESADSDALAAYDDDKFSIEVTDVNPDHEDGYALNVKLKNKTSDVPYNIGTDSIIVNGVSAYDSWYEDLSEGAEISRELVIEDATMLQEIGTVTHVALTLHVNNSKTYDRVVEEIKLNVYPNGENKATTYKRAKSSNDVVLIDNQYAKVTLFNGVKSKDSWDNIEEYDAYIYIENKSSSTLSLELTDEKVDGTAVDLYTSNFTYINKGASTFGSLSVESYTMKEAKLSKIKEITFTLNCNVNYKTVATEEITLEV